MILNINEVYFGKTLEMQQLEEQLDKFRSKYIGTTILNTYGLGSDPDLLKFNRMLEQQFGFGCAALCIFTGLEANSFTQTIDMRYDVFNTTKSLIANKSTFKFDKNADYTCIIFISTGLILNPNYTTSEVMSIILHEIGHNFYDAINDIAGFAKIYSVLAFIKSIYGICMEEGSGNPIISDTANYKRSRIIGALGANILSSSNNIDKIIIKLNSFVKSHSVIKGIFENISKLISVCTISASAIVRFCDVFTLGIPKLLGMLSEQKKKLINPFTYIITPFGYREERTADNFVTMYGYAGDLSSFLSKATSKNEPPLKILEAFYKIPIVSNIYAINSSLADLISSAFDEHPIELSRCNDQILMLKRELSKSDLDPKMKKVIQSDIEACQKQIQILTDINKSLDNKDILRNIWHNILYRNFGCKTIKDLADDKKKFDRYDKVYYGKLT